MLKSFANSLSERAGPSGRSTPRHPAATPAIARPACKAAHTSDPSSRRTGGLLFERARGKGCDSHRRSISLHNLRPYPRSPSRAPGPRDRPDCGDQPLWRCRGDRREPRPPRRSGSERFVEAKNRDSCWITRILGPGRRHPNGPMSHKGRAGGRWEGYLEKRAREDHRAELHPTNSTFGTCSQHGLHLECRV